MICKGCLQGWRVVEGGFGSFKLRKPPLISSALFRMVSYSTNLGRMSRLFPILP